MELMEAIKNRHSVRQYKDEPKAFDGFMAHYGKFSGVTS